MKKILNKIIIEKNIDANNVILNEINIAIPKYIKHCIINEINLKEFKFASEECSISLLTISEIYQNYLLITKTILLIYKVL